MAGEAKKWNNTAKFMNVPIIDVTKENVIALGPVVRGAIIGADYIAIDCVSFLLEKILLLLYKIPANKTIPTAYLYQEENAELICLTKSFIS